MGDEDRQSSLETLREKDNWVVWKTKDDKWTQELRGTVFHQLLTLNKNTRDDCWGNKNPGMVAKRRHEIHKMQKNKGMLGEIPSKRTK
jgi:hypothetical protein